MQVSMLIKQSYDEQNKSLNLYGKFENWNIILQGDWSSLEKLNIGGCQITDQKINLITQNKNWTKLKSLQLKNNEISAQGIKTLLSNQWPSLEEINLQQNKIEVEGFLLIIQKLQKLRKIQLWGCQINGLDFKQLLQQNFVNLKYLSFNINKIGVAGAKILSKLDMPQIQQFVLGYCELGNEGVKQLSKGKWPNLQILWLHYNNIELDGLISLQNAAWISLKKLAIYLVNHICCMSLISMQAQTTKVVYWGTDRLKFEISKLMFERFDEQ